MKRHKPDSLPGRLIAFFAANPGEELNYADVCAKFGVAKRTAHVIVGRMVRDGELNDGSPHKST